MEELVPLKISTYANISDQLSELQTKLESGGKVEGKFYEGIQDNIDLLFQHVIGFFKGKEQCYERSQTMIKKLLKLIQLLANSNSEMKREFKENLERLSCRVADARLTEAKQSTLFMGQLITEIETKVIKKVLGEHHDDIVTIEQMERAIEREGQYKSVLSDRERERAKRVWKDEQNRLKLNSKLILFMNAVRRRRNIEAHPPVNKAGYDRALASEQDPHRKQKCQELWNIYQQL